MVANEEIIDVSYLHKGGVQYISKQDYQFIHYWQDSLYIRITIAYMGIVE